MPEPWIQPSRPFVVSEVRWENCTGLSGVFEVPRSQATAAVPPAFEPWGLTGQTASVLFMATQCPRVTDGARLLNHEGYAALYVRVNPANVSWQQERPSLYVLDMWTTSEVLAQSLRQLALEAHATTLGRNVTVAPSANLTMERWEYLGPDTSVRFEFVQEGEPWDGGVFNPYLWVAAPGGYRRVDAKESFVYERLTLQGGALRMEGSPSSGGILAATCCAAWAGRALADASGVWSSNETVFRP